MLEHVEQFESNNIDFEKLYDVHIKAEASNLLQEKNNWFEQVRESEKKHQLLQGY